MNRFRTDVAFWPLERVEKLGDQLLDWQGESNVYQSGSGFELWHYKSAERQIGPTMKSLADWRRRWGGKDANAVEGEIRFQGGGFRHRVGATPYLITPQDFRLVEGSAGYRAGRDGKDLGVDVDLVGPGAAYERWKKTPEYREWLEETRQQE
jgi:hypothetical protein